MTKILSLLAAVTLILGACSTSNQVAQQKSYNDDVYFSDAKATEQKDIVRTTPKSRPTYRSDDDMYDDDYVYLSRRNQYYLAPRYSYITPYNRFDPWFDSYAYGYYNWYTPGITLYFGANPWLYNNIYSYNYGYPSYYNNGYGGLYSYNTYYPGYNFGSYGGGSYNDPNYRSRPTLRGAENLSGNTISTIRRDADGRIMTSPSRGETYQGTNPAATRTTSATGTTARPARVQNAGNQQPVTQRAPQVQSQPEPRQSAPAPSSSGGGGGGGGSSDDSRARPSRAGN